MTDTPPKDERHVSIRFPVAVLEALRNLAKQHERSLVRAILNESRALEQK
jgi:hypothetical protein